MGSVPFSPAGFEAVARGFASAPAGVVLLYHLTHWSYRQPISYLVTDAAGAELGRVGPPDEQTRTTSLLWVGAQPVLVLTLDRRGNTTVSGAGGAPVGSVRRRRALLAYTMDLRLGDAPAGALEQPGLHTGPAVVRGPDGTPAAWLHRSGGRFAGAALSRLELTPAAAPVPGPLLLAVVPALDAFRRAVRSARQ